MTPAHIASARVQAHRHGAGKDGFPTFGTMQPKKSASTTADVKREAETGGRKEGK